MTIAIIRIHGKIGLKKDIKETLNRLGLRKKYSCLVIDNPTKPQLGMIKKVKDFVAYGEINKETHEKLVKVRENKKTRGFFRLHPPRGGIESKKHFGVGKGVLGNNKDKINQLIERML
jgi:large subunit ribosomal protein L30